MMVLPPRMSPSPTVAERFGLNLWRSRRWSGLTQEDLSGLAGLSRDAIRRLENGERHPRLDTILQLAAGTNVSPCVLLNGMAWQPGRYVDGDFYVEHPASKLRMGVQK
jgi:transcriptional regulator with XRE-family HTH domain